MKENEQLILFKNYFYDNWNLNSFELVEFILPLENIEILQKINLFKDDISILNVKIFSEYPNENIAIILIEKNKQESKIFLI